MDPQPGKGAELAFLALLLRKSQVKVRRAASVTGEERGNFFQAAGKYYSASRVELTELVRRGIDLDEIPVALLLARSARVTPLEVVALRSHGKSWPAIMSILQVGPEVLYAPAFPDEEPTPYESNRDSWDVLLLRDSDVVNLVNLKFISEHYSYRPEQVIALCSTGWTFASIHAAIARPRPVEKRPRRVRTAIVASTLHG